MSNHLVNCPFCKKLLRSDRPLPSGTTLRCPECKAGFSAPEPGPIPELHSPTPSLIGPAFFIAVAVSLILGGSVITAAILLSGNRPVEEPKKDDTTARLAEEQKKLDAARQKLDDDRKKLELSRLLVDGETALAAGRFDEAEKAFNKALEIAPTEAAVVKGLANARAGREVSRKAEDEGKKRDGERDRLLTEARKLIADKQYARAVPLLETARSLGPTDAAVLTALTDAKTALDADAAEKKKLAEYNAHLAAGKTALEGGRFTDALREVTAALAIVPDSAEAKDLQKAAEGKLAAAGDDEKRNRAFEALLTKARAAVDGKRYNEAIASLEGAMRLVPDDREGTRLLRTARESLEKVKSANTKLIAQANAAATAGRLEDAVRLATDATRNWVEDESAKKALKNAERLLETTRANQEAYVRYMQAGALAMATGAYPDAVAAYTQAQLLVPTDIEVARLLRNARIAADALLRNRTEYERQVRIGTTALSRQNYTEAITAFRAAGKLLPDDLAWREGISRARYGQSMASGNQAMKLGRKKEAIAAFEAALTERAGDPAALRALELAKRMVARP